MSRGGGHKKVLIRTELVTMAAKMRRRGTRLVFTNGCFDLLHPGHIHLISKAAALGDRLVVAINSDRSVRRLKGSGRPIYPATERSEILLSLRWVDYVTIFNEDTPLETIRRLRPDVLVKGGEYREEDIVGASLVRASGGRVVRIHMKKGYATRAIVRRAIGS